jgi:phage terminase small subunit
MIKRYNDAIKAINDFDSKLGDRPNAEKKAKPAVMTKKEFWL